MSLPQPPIRRALTAMLLVPILGVMACSGSDGASPSASATGTAGGTPSSDSPTTSTVPSPEATLLDANGFPVNWVAPSLDWSPCGDVAANAECATLTVPLDWAAPTGPTIDLALGRIAATGDRIGSLLTNPGGPGGSGLEFLGYEPFSDVVKERFDIVSWDPRGVGGSTAVTCGQGVPALLALDPDPDDDAEQEQLDAAANAVSQECAASDLDLLSHIGTSQVARDMEGIRRALGNEPLNFVGFSYGTQIGQTYAQMFPTQIRTMVLDGVVDPSLSFTDFLLGQTAAFEESFNNNAKACKEEGVGTCGVPDLKAAYDKVHKMVEEQPLGSDDKVVGPAELAIAAVMTSYWADGWEDLGPALAAGLKGKSTALRQLADSYYDFGSFTAYAGVVCTDTPPPAGDEAYEGFADMAREISPRLGGTVANELLSCATWPVAPVGVPAAVTAPGAPPILVVGNTDDAATPYDNAVAVSKSLESGVLVSADIAGHTAYGVNECVTDVVDAYLIDLVVPSKDPRCT